MPNKDLTDIKKRSQAKSKTSFYRFGMGLMFVVMIMIYTSQGMGLSSPQGYYAGRGLHDWRLHGHEHRRQRCRQQRGASGWFALHHHDRCHHYRRHF